MARQSLSLSGLWTTFKGFTLCQLCLAVIFVVGGTVINILQASLYLSLRPRNANLYRKINFYLTYAFNAPIVFAIEWWSGTNPVLFTDPSNVQQYFGKEHALLVMNHGCDLGWAMAGLMSERVGVAGNMKGYSKKNNMYVPVVGWSWRFQEYVFLERNWEKDKTTLSPQLSNLVDYPDPVWLILLPEGTRLSQEKYDASMEVARRKGLPILKHHLLPRTKGFVSSIPHLKGKFGAIYDWTIVPDKDCVHEPSLLSLVQGKEVKTVSMVRRIPFDEVPSNEEEATQWLHKLFQDKDKFVDNYLTTGEFVPKQDKDKDEYEGYQYLQLPKRPNSLVIQIIWTLVIIVPLVIYVLRTITTGSFLVSVGVILVGGISLFVLNRIINMCRSQTTSSYRSSKCNRRTSYNA